MHNLVLVLFGLLTATPLVMAMVYQRVNRGRVLVFLFGLTGLLTALFWVHLSDTWQVVAWISLAVAGVVIGLLHWGIGLGVTLLAALLIFGGGFVWTPLSDAFAQRDVATEIGATDEDQDGTASLAGADAHAGTDSDT